MMRIKSKAINFQKNKGLYHQAFITGGIFLILAVLLAINLGVADIPFNKSVAIIMSKIPFLKKLVSVEDISQSSMIIILNLRLPRILLAAIVGAGLAVAGAAFQGVFKNPMAEAHNLGISSGAALGAALTLAFGCGANFWGFGLVTVNAFVGAIVTSLLIYNIARIGNKVQSLVLLLSGISINIFFTSIISLIMAFKREQIESIVMWTMGSVVTADWNKVWLVLPIVLSAIAIIMIYSRDLNIILLGDESAKSLGVSVGKVRKIVLGVSALMVAAIVSVSGIIGFAGLLIPHMIRLLFGPDHRIVIPFSALGGAVFLIACDTLSRTLVPPYEIPLGIVTSLFGIPFFLYLIYRNKKKVS